MKKTLLITILLLSLSAVYAQVGTDTAIVKPKGKGWFGISAGPSSYNLDKGMDSYAFGLDMAYGWKYWGLAFSLNNFYWQDGSIQYPLYRSASARVGYQHYGKRLVWGLHAGPQFWFRSENATQYTTYLRAEASAFFMVRIGKLVGLNLIPFTTFGVERNVSGIKLALCITDK